MSKIENAVIKDTMLGTEDHGIMTAYVYLEFSCGSCGFGGYALDGWSEAKKKRTGSAYGMEYLSRLMTTVGVEKWEDLKGKHVRAENEGLGGSVLRIGHIIKDQWFDPKELANEYA